MVTGHGSRGQEEQLKGLKLDLKNQKSTNTIAEALKARRARNELQTLESEKAN